MTSAELSGERRVGADSPSATRARTRHVCQLVHSLSVGGAEKLAVTLGKSIALRHRISFVCLDELGEMAAPLRQDGYEVQCLERPAGVSAGCARRLSEYLRREGVDLVHAHQYTPFFYALAARHVRRGPKVLFTEHGRWYPDYPRRKRMMFNRLFLRRHDRVVAVGESVRQALIENEGIKPSHIEVIYNGVDLNSFGEGCANRESMRQNLDLAPETFTVIQVARLDALKDHATALRAMRHLVREERGSRLLVVGEGPQRGEIERMIQEYGLEQHVQLLGTRNDVAALLVAADAFLLSSVSEGIPLTVIEAMAAGLPVVATSVGGVAEMVTVETGLLAAAGDDAALARHLVFLARSPDCRRSMGKAGRHRAKERFGQEPMLARYAQVYEEMLA